MQKHHGTIANFDNERKFGFIQFDNKNRQIFFHVSRFKAGRNPNIGEQVLFDIGQDKQGRPVAINIQEAQFVAQKQQERKQKQQAYKAYQERQEQKHGQLNLLCGVGVGYLLILAIVLLISGSSLKLLGVYFIMGIISFFMYYQDKIKAQNNEWRIPENTLHAIDVLGGWIGATFAHKLLNHKATKADFRVVFYITIVLNIIGFLALVFYVK
ncbi:DUF1294 domain-containing protein [Moraxella nonliquefaciens]|uniref:DUF1294 domain-containing protein n=1 Tax=Moraxella nonliquefaciens TaxID=478 RepID=UPI0024ADCC5E|nr:DUF1294 domain-containing protein [Moraxella nonliquefaciens]MDI4497683.1 DUF1294 domain-containing protein [Moraxella nonliquefaciens]